METDFTVKYKIKRTLIHKREKKTIIIAHKKIIVICLCVHCKDHGNLSMQYQTNKQFLIIRLRFPLYKYSKLNDQNGCLTMHSRTTHGSVF